MERSVQNLHKKNTSVENYDFIMQPYETIPRINFGKQRIGLAPSTVDQAFQTKTY